MSSIQEIQEEIVEEFDLFDDWQSRYEYLIDLGKSLPVIDEKHKTTDNLIKGCQSQVWLHAEEKNESIIFTADSDAIITKGIVALLLRVYSHQKAQDILSTEPQFIDRIALKEHLSPTRSNGLVSMIKQIKNYALAFKCKDA